MTLPSRIPGRLLARRHFNAMGLASLAAASSWLAGCGGGTAAEPGSPAASGEGEGGAQGRALPLVGVGMQGLQPWTVAGPGPQQLVLKALEGLSDGRVALAWVDVAAPGHLGPWRLHLRVQSCEGACGGSDRVLSSNLGDAGAAVAVLPDGSTLVAWRDTLERVPNDYALTRRLLLQRFSPLGEAAGDPEVVDSFVFTPVLEGGGRSLGPPAIGHWEDGSFVVAWADVRGFGYFPGIAASVRTRRYAANGWPPASARTVATSYREAAFSLAVPPASGGYVLSHVEEPQTPLYQSILPLEFWNPLPASALARLLPGSFLLSLGVCGTLLFAGRTDPVTGLPVFTRERFEYSGHAAGSPALLPGLPVGGIALRDVEFLTLAKSASPGRLQAQRMDKYGRILGLPFEMPQGPSLLRPDGSLLVAWAEAGEGGSQVLLQRFVPLPVTLGPGLAAL